MTSLTEWLCAWRQGAHALRVPTTDSGQLLSINGPRRVDVAHRMDGQYTDSGRRTITPWVCVVNAMQDA